VNWAGDHAVTVVVAAKGYPGAYEKGSPIAGLDDIVGDSRQMVFHAGTSRTEHGIVSAGGRVLNATSRGSSLQEARDAAYALVDRIDWRGGMYRRDIGWRALRREAQSDAAQANRS
ncbi:MAG: hypothetical protein OXJ64_06545, partial [Boseongicola sp.]|nr:hypothetical protein [Boseongicola sp.]